MFLMIFIFCLGNSTLYFFFKRLTLKTIVQCKTEITNAVKCFQQPDSSRGHVENVNF